MQLFSDADRRFSEAVSQLAYTNPFLPERIEREKAVLGRQFNEPRSVWSRRVEEEQTRPNVLKIRERVDAVVDKTHGRLKAQDARRDAIAEPDRTLYQDLVHYVLYYRYWASFSAAISASDPRDQKVPFWEDFRRDFVHLLAPVLGPDTAAREARHLFACLFQLRRAFHHTFNFIVGASPSAARLRARIWQSIFTHDVRRYRRSLFDKMGDITTLITGPSGTGKELVARAIGLSRFLPFDPRQQRFDADPHGLFSAVNLSALSPSLIESELFGHRRGAFTGATEDRTGWLEACPPLGTVFLDEIGELDASIQVKLLRVLQDRAFQRLGDTTERHFEGKIVAATNRDLAHEMLAGRFREDLYYRLCSDLITTPSLAEQLAEAPDDLPNLVRYLAQRICSDEADALADEVVEWVTANLGADYAWPGNIRELEQCVRNILVHKEYCPLAATGDGSQGGSPPAVRPGNGAAADTGHHEAAASLARRIADEMAHARLTAEELLQHYCTLVYATAGSYEATARQLKLDRRTVKSKVNLALLDS